MACYTRDLGQSRGRVAIDAPAEILVILPAKSKVIDQSLAEYMVIAKPNYRSSLIGGAAITTGTGNRVAVVSGRYL